MSEAPVSMLVWRDAAGVVVNIGPWDHQWQTVFTNPLPADAENRPERVPLLRDGEPVMRLVRDRPGEEPEFEAVMTDGPPRWFRGDVLIHEGEWDNRPENVERNPIPAGVTSSEELTRERDDGGIAAAGDYESLRRAAYPPLKDQLDAMWKGGAEADAMRAIVLGVKERFPKP